MDTENLVDDVQDSISDDAITMAGLSFVSSPAGLALPLPLPLTLVPQVDLSGSLTTDVECLPINGVGESISLDENDLALVSQEAMLNMEEHPVEMQFEQPQDQTEEVHKTSVPVNDFNVDAGQVYLIYQDILTCGTCNKHFLDLIDFLQHKASHSIGNDAYKCELCKTLLINVPTLRDHYLRKHQVQLEVANGTSTNCLLNNVIPTGNEIAGEANVNGTIDVIVTKTNESVDDGGDGNQGGVVTVDSTPRGGKRGRRVVRGGAAAQRSGSEADFLFTLRQEPGTDGTTSVRESCECLHCTFCSEDRHAFSAHMLTCHASVLAAGINGAWTDAEPKSDGSCLMRMSKYNRICAPPAKAKTRRRRKLEKQDVPGAYPCVTCGKTFGRLRYLRKHVETHRTERRFACGVCGAHFKSKTYLAVHVRCVHGRTREFRCTRCDFTSRVNAAIQAHRQLHAQPGAVQCETCGLAYADRATLNKHRRVHDERRPYACTHAGCTWRFNTEHMCRAHARAHTTPAAFRCSVCGYAFRHKHHLQRHETNMHGIAHPKTRCGTNRRKQPTTATNTTFVPDTEPATDTLLDSTTTSVFELPNDINGEVVLSL